MHEGVTRTRFTLHDGGAAVVLALALAAYVLIFGSLLPDATQPMAHDYSLHLPNLLVGHFHMLRNGMWTVPWFSPAQCGGVPFIADPNVAYYSLTQWLTFSIGPTAAIRTTILVFAALGAIGTYLLLRVRFRLSPAASVLGAILFLFNGMYISRMAAGHITFHPFALTPWLALAVLSGSAASPSRTWRFTGATIAIVAVGAMFAYAFQSGMIHLILPVALILVTLIAIHGHLFGHRWRPWTVLVAGSVLSVLFSAQRLNAAFSLLGSFPRDLYTLPGFPSFIDSVLIPLRSVFFYPSFLDNIEAMTESEVGFGFHEWDYSFGPAAALLLVAGGAVLLYRLISHGPSTPPYRSVALAAFLCIVIAIPIALNVWTPGWNAFLKSLPFFGSSVILVRWYAVFIPLVVLGCALAVDRLTPVGALRWGTGLSVVAATLIWSAATEKLTSGIRYDGSIIEASWSIVQTPEDVPPISEITLSSEIFQPNDFVIGGSQMACYQPLFGYDLRAFPRKRLRSGSTFSVNLVDELNVKNPACYVFPEENNCSPGDHFKDAEADGALNFVSYDAFEFERSTRQRLADRVNLWALIAAPAAILLAILADAAIARRRARAA